MSEHSLCPNPQGNSGAGLLLTGLLAERRGVCVCVCVCVCVGGGSVFL